MKQKDAGGDIFPFIYMALVPKIKIDAYYYYAVISMQYVYP